MMRGFKIVLYFLYATIAYLLYTQLKKPYLHPLTQWHKVWTIYKSVQKKTIIAAIKVSELYPAC